MDGQTTPSSTSCHCGGQVQITEGLHLKSQNTASKMATGAHTTAGMSVDEAFQVLGTGRINIAMYLILCLNFMYVPMHIFGDLFNTRIPPHHCKDLVLANDKSDLLNSSKKHSDQVVVARRRHGSYLVPERSDMPNTYGYFYNERTCHLTLLDPDEGNKTIECEFGHWFDTSYTGETIVSEWELVCERNSEVVFITIHGVAAVLGAVIFAPFSDKYGRKALLLMCWSQMALMSLGMYFVGDMSSYMVLRFLQRLYVEGAEQAIFILSCEMLPTTLRPNAVSGLYIFYGLGYLVMSLQAYLSTSWRHLQLAVAVGSFVLLPINFMLPESPYWLVFMGREKSAEKFFREAANMNKTKLPVGFKLKREVVEDDGVSQFDESKRRHHRSPRHCYSHEDVPSNVIDNLHSNNNSMAVSCLMLGAADSGTESRHTIHPHVGHFKELFQVLSNKMLRKEAGIASFTWAVSAFLYYGMTVSGFNPGEDAYLNFFLSGVAVIVSSASTTFILRRFGRKKPITVFCFLCAIFMLLKSTIPYNIDGVKLKILHKVLKFLAKLFAAAIVSSTQLIVAELFPTTVRSTCVGLVAFFGLLGASLGMYFSILERVSQKGSTIAAGILTLLAGYLIRSLPDTSNRPLPGTIVDLMDSYASFMEAIVQVMTTIPGAGGDAAESKHSSRASSIKFTKRRRSSISSIMNLRRIVSDRRRRPSISSRVFKLTRFNTVGKIKYNVSAKDDENNKWMARVNLNNEAEETTTTHGYKSSINPVFSNDAADIVTKF